MIASLNALANAENENEVADLIAVLAGQLGFQHFRLDVDLQESRFGSSRYVLHRLPPYWHASYESKRYYEMDPALKQCRERVLPIVWSNGLFAEAITLRQDAAAFGLHHGVTLPMHAPHGAFGMLSLASGSPLPESDGELTDVVAKAQLIANHALHALGRVVIPTLLQKQATSLSKREVECIQWVSKGKTSWEIAKILSISERTAIFHLANVTRKLGVANRAQAAAKCVTLGVI